MTASIPRSDRLTARSVGLAMLVLLALQPLLDLWIHVTQTVDMAEPVVRGIGAALVTLFDERGEVDASATAEHAVRLVELGMRAVLVAGSTGEAASLSPKERTQLLDHVRAALGSNNDVPVIAGTGAPSAYQAAALTAAAIDHGADAVVVLSPPGAADPRPYYDEVVKAANGVPVIAYHYPALSPPGIPVELLHDLPVAGCKDSSANCERLLDEITTWDGHLYLGTSGLLALAGPLGCTGAILAVANAAPELCIRAFAGEADAQRELAPAHLAAHRAFPAGIKGLTADRFGTSTTSRLG